MDIQQHLGTEVEVILVATDCQVLVAGTLTRTQAGSYLVTPPGGGARAEFGPGAIELIQPAQHRWRAVNAPHLVTLVVRAGARFEKGKLGGRPDEPTPITETQEAA